MTNTLKDFLTSIDSKSTASESQCNEFINMCFNELNDSGSIK